MAQDTGRFGAAMLAALELSDTPRTLRLVTTDPPQRETPMLDRIVHQIEALTELGEEFDAIAERMFWLRTAVARMEAHAAFDAAAATA